MGTNARPEGELLAAIEIGLRSMRARRENQGKDSRFRKLTEFNKTPISIRLIGFDLSTC
jgi:hypothetical protein